jgi:hypothetical protein
VFGTCSEERESTMPLGDRAYRNTVPPEARQLAEDRGLGECNWFIRGADAPPYYPDSVREILRKVAALDQATDGEPRRPGS